ncbi:maleylpyruvate isomerase N-terminal domain-containing protein [Streptomyces sp. NPDC006553]|uniref:maleylpyruvate isomerase N-terminal domain-containing protein n=1 Tax=Streptomyces sp. NPDC006553 TaxID=3157180 RepID=UPI0033B4F7B7
MGIVTTFDAVAEHERTRVALRAVVLRLVRLLRDVPDLEAASGVPVWTVGDVGAHLAGVHVAYSTGFTDETLEWDALLPPDSGSFSERIAAVNATSIGLFGGEERTRIGEFIGERSEMFLRVTEGLAPDSPVNAPWLGKDLPLTLAGATGLMLSESLVHGLDIARGAGLPWTIGPDEASLVLGQAMPTMMPLGLDAEKARGVSISFDLAVKGGPRLAVVVENGAATVTRDAPPRTYDCRITAEPVAFLLVSFRRMPVWKAIAYGRMRAGGRRPWLAMRLGDLIGSP